MMVPASRTRRMIIQLLAPAVLWSLHFLFVYVFVSLACLWAWDGITFLGASVLKWIVALETFIIGAAIISVAVRSWREREASPDLLFLARIAVMTSILFLFATLFVGLLTLPTAACH